MKPKSISLVYLGEYVLQKDMRIRMPKEIVKNLNVKPGESYFEVYLDIDNKDIVLLVKEGQQWGK